MAPEEYDPLFLSLIPNDTLPPTKADATSCVKCGHPITQNDLSSISGFENKETMISSGDATSDTPTSPETPRSPSEGSSAGDFPSQQTPSYPSTPAPKPGRGSSSTITTPRPTVAPRSSKRTPHPLSFESTSSYFTATDTTATATADHSGHPVFSVTFSLHPSLSKHDPAHAGHLRKWMASPHRVRFYHSVFHVIVVIEAGSMRGVYSKKEQLKRSSEDHGGHLHHAHAGSTGVSGTNGANSLFDILQGSVVTLRWTDPRPAAGKMKEKAKEDKEDAGQCTSSDAAAAKEKQAAETPPEAFSITFPDATTSLPTILQNLSIQGHRIFSISTFDATRTTHSADCDAPASPASPAAKSPAKQLQEDSKADDEAEKGASHALHQVDADVQRDAWGFADAEDAVCIVRGRTAAWFRDMAEELVESPRGLEWKDHGVT